MMLFEQNNKSKKCHVFRLKNALFMCPLRIKSLVVILCFPFFKSDVQL